MARGLFTLNEWEEESHEQVQVIESCYLCARPFMGDSDIFMYKGNTPFCSEDCRQEQIEFDEAREEKKRKLLARTSVEADQACTGEDIRQGGIQVA